MAMTFRKALLWGSALVALGGAGRAGYHTYLNLFQPANKIQPLNNGRYNGVFANHSADGEHVGCFEQRTGQKADIVVRYVNFDELRTAFPFPFGEAGAVQKRGSVLFIKLEPWSGRGPDDPTYSLQDILSGKLDAELEAFAKGCRAFGGPVFISFGHEMNGSWYPWAGNPQDYVQAYRYVHDKVSQLEWFGESGKCPGVTWVWNPNALGPGIQDFDPYYPGAECVDWVAVNIFHDGSETAEAVLERLEKSIAALKKYGKPIMIGEFASSAPAPQKADFLRKLLQKIKGWDISGFVHFNVPTTQGGLLKSWSLTEKEPTQAYQEGLRQMDEMLRRNIVTAGGELEDESAPPEQNPDCKKIERTYYSPYEARRIEELQTYIDENEVRFFRPIIGGDVHYNNERRIILAQHYQELYGITHDRNQIAKAAQILSYAMHDADFALVYHWEKGFVRNFVEVMLQTAYLYTQTDSIKALRFCEEVFTYLDGLEKIGFFNPNQERAESLPGYHHKLMFIKARVLESLGRFEEAKVYYFMIMGWSGEEIEKPLFGSTAFHDSLTLPWETPWWRGETPLVEPWDRADLQYDHAQAKIRLGYILLHQGKTTEAIRLFTEVLEMERMGKIGWWSKAKNFFGLDDDKAFLDLTYEALICLMRAYIMENPDTARQRFNTELPWVKIQGYTELLKSLNINRSQPFPINRWDLFAQRLAGKDLPGHLTAHLRVIRGLK